MDGMGLRGPNEKNRGRLMTKYKTHENRNSIYRVRGGRIWHAGDKNKAVKGNGEEML